MRLTRKENEMLEGKYGYAVQKSMEILVSLGECYDAKKMISATSSHLLNSLSSIGKGGALFIQEMADQGGKFIILSTTESLNPFGIAGTVGLDQQDIVQTHAK